MMKTGPFRMRAASAAMSVAVAFGTLSLGVFAATGTVTGDSINVRSDASTSSSIVGTANAGDELEVGDSKDDDSGNTWYQVTLDDGSTGYIRNDFINVTEDEEPAEADSEATEADTEAEIDTSSDSSSAGITQTGDYQVVMAPDDDGNDVYYLYNNAAGERMKISDIEALQSRVIEAENAANSAGNKYRIILIALAVLLVLALVGCVTLFLRLRDAMSNGRRERDLTRDRANERRRGTGADDLSAVKKRTREDRRAGASSRSNAYASGTRRRPAPTDGAESREARPAREVRRSAAGEGDYSRAREGARPVRTGSDAQREGTRPVRPSSDAQREGTRPVRPSSDAQRETTRRPVSDDRRAASSEGHEVRRERPARPAGDEDVRTTRPRIDRTSRSTSAAAEGESTSAPRSSAAQNAAPARATRTQAKNFADSDDDFDYDFISLDDN